MSDPVTKTTVLDGYYASGDYECFCFDKWDGPEAYSQAFPYSPDRDLEQTDKEIAAQDANRVYPDDLVPDGAHYGRWTITVEFEPLPEPAALKKRGNRA